MEVEELPTTQGAVHRFANLTGMHGVPNIAIAKSIFRRIVWILLTLTMTGLTLWQLTQAVQKLLSYPVSTTVSFTYASPMNFPAVTICNLNPIKYGQLDKYKNNTFVQQLLSTLGSQTSGPVEFTSSNSSGTSWDSRDQISPRQDALSAAKVYKYLSSLPDGIANNISYSIGDILIDCSFNGRNCVPNDFFRFRTSRYGNCFSFNNGMYPNKTSRKVKQVTKTGSDYGLQLTLYVDQRNYIPKVIGNAGFKVLIENQNVPPLPQSNGYEVSPGFQTSFGIRTLISERAKSPHGNCLNFTAAQNASLNHLVGQLPQTSPSTEVCLQVCEQLLIIAQCNCSTYLNGLTSGPPYKNANKVSANNPCDVASQSADVKCIERVTKNSSAYCKANDCKHVECIAVRYLATPSFSSWPAEYAFTSLLDTVKSHPDRTLLPNLENKTSAQMRTFIYRNFVKVNIYFKRLEIEYVLTESSYTLITFIGDLGGITGLWLGFSILTFFELVEFIIDVFISFYYCNKVMEVQDTLNKSKESIEGNDEELSEYYTRFSRPSRRLSAAKIS